MEFAYAPSDTGDPASDVIAGDAIIGRIVRREQIGRNLVRDYRYSALGGARRL